MSVASEAPHSGRPGLTAAPAIFAAATVAAVVPALLAYNLPPSPTLLNQCLAVALWGGFVLVLAPTRLSARALTLHAALAIVALSAWFSWFSGGLPASLMLSALALLAGAAALVWAGSDAASGPDATVVFNAFAVGLTGAGLLSALVALIQVFAPDWADGNVIAHSGLIGRAVGNLRQPNHLCSLLLWGVVGTAVLVESGLLGHLAATMTVAALVFAVELSASRTGALGLIVLALWGLLDRRLARSTRQLLISTPVIYALSYGAMAWYGDWSHQAIGAEARIASGEATGIESPNSRLRIWSNAAALIEQQPWRGVGFGEFNLAWSLTPFPGRPTAFFDHTHTLPLQLAVELGLPLALLTIGLLGLALWQSWRRSFASDGGAGTAARSAWMLVVLTGLHSLFEYPLWYAYFLLPAAFAWGFALGLPSANAAREPETAYAWAGKLVGGVLVLGGALAILDYTRIVDIYAPGNNAGPLEARIAAGQRSVLFAHHADYAAATSAEPLPGTALAFRRAPHSLMDTRLMMAWASYLANQGELDKARALAERVREFRNPESESFFAACTNGLKQQFQCKGPETQPNWRAYLSSR